jgi:hypothetical protein
VRFMIIVKATEDTEAGRFPPEPEKQELFACMAAFHEELHKAGALLGGSGLNPSSSGWRIQYAAGKPLVIDGPFAETKELIAGYTLIQCKSREEALEWTRRFPNPMGVGKPAQIEVRQLYEIEDFGELDGADRLREIGMQ